jgi:peptide-methionine (S)-S-oxide reductase
MHSVTPDRTAKLWHRTKYCHQQYLHKNPGGYCGLGGTGLSCPVGVAPAE